MAMAAASSFFLIWTTPPSTFRPRFMRSLESIFKHHADAAVTVFSNTLPVHFFAQLSRAGLQVAVERYELADMLAGTRGEVWFDFRRFWNRSAYYANHEADLLRLLLLRNHGGVYLDTDVVFVQPLPAEVAGCDGLVGIESGTGGLPLQAMRTDSSAKAIAAGEHSTHGVAGAGVAGAGTARAAGEGLGGGAILCNALMSFGRGSTFVERAVERFFSRYVPFPPELSLKQLFMMGIWGAMGPILLTDLARDMSEMADVNAPREPAVCALEQSVFYPITPPEAPSLFSPWQELRDSTRLRRLERESIAVHYWNQLSAQEVLACGSLMHTLLERHCVVCVPLPCV